MAIRTAILMTAVTAVAVLPGCYESPTVTVFEPGVYKGDVDPLLAKQRSTAQQEALQERFSMVQTDR